MKSIGQISYEAYCKSSGGVSLISRAQLPPWGDLHPEIKRAWEAAAQAVVALCNLEDESTINHAE